ncbi:MAG TPA: hypothetical protein VLI55_10800, partial [Bryobacteraceae bacterium]|nr:hypothetical protein [Bryobacteraceae bacterium]
RVDHLVAGDPNLPGPYGGEVFRDCRSAVETLFGDRVKENDIVGVDLEGASTSPLFQRSFARRSSGSIVAVIVLTSVVICRVSQASRASRAD